MCKGKHLSLFFFFAKTAELSKHFQPSGGKALPDSLEDGWPVQEDDAVVSGISSVRCWQRGLFARRIEEH